MKFKDYINYADEDAWIEEQARLDAKFKKDCLTEVGLCCHKNKEAIWQYAHRQVVEDQGMDEYEIHMFDLLSSLTDLFYPDIAKR